MKRQSRSIPAKPVRTVERAVPCRVWSRRWAWRRRHRARSDTLPGRRVSDGASVEWSCTRYRQSPRASTSRRTTLPVSVVVTGVSRRMVAARRVSSSAKSMPSNKRATRLHALPTVSRRYRLRSASGAATKNATIRRGKEGAVSRENQRIAPQPMTTGTKRKSCPNARSSVSQTAIFRETETPGSGLSTRGGRTGIATATVRCSGNRISTVPGAFPCIVSAYPKCCFSP